MPPIALLKVGFALRAEVGNGPSSERLFRGVARSAARSHELSRRDLAKDRNLGRWIAPDSGP
jgi:hypothetical protein